MKNKKRNYFKYFTITVIFFVACLVRIRYFGQTGKDIYAYEKSAEDLLTGVNPYIWTIKSYSNPDDPGNHGYAYLPLLLYINSFFYVLGTILDMPFFVLSKIPVLLADLGVGLLLVRYLYGKSFQALLAALLFWFWNPYFVLKHNYVYTDPIPVFLCLLALFYLEKDDVLAGVFLALAVAAKPFSIVFLPLFLIRAAKPLKLFVASAIVGVVLSIPFLKSWTDFMIYLNGAVFVHGERFVQGRPFLFFISYYGKIELIRMIPIKIYAYSSVILAWVVSIISHFLWRFKDKYLIGAFSLLVFYFLTPVLNRTYLIWLMPIFIVAVYNLFNRKAFVYYSFLASYWTFYYVYLYYWRDGFHIWHP